jgi:hypothetical protein
MSERAATYYAERGFEPTPEILEGALVQLVAPYDLPQPRELASVFAEKVAPLSEYVLQGVRFNMEAYDGYYYTDEEWLALRRKHPQFGSYHSAQQFGERNFAPALLSKLPDFGFVQMEAIPPEDRYRDVFLRTARGLSTHRRPLPHDADQEHSAAHLLSRTFTPDGEKCVSSHITTVWGEIRRPTNKVNHFISVRYLGAAFLPKEIDAMPELHKR